MAYRDFKDLPSRTSSDKILCDKAFNIAKNPKHNGYKPRLASTVYKFLIKSFLVVLSHVQINPFLKVKLC